MASGSIQWAPPKPLHLEGNVSENFRKFEEHWTLFEKTEPKGKSEEEKCSYFLLCIGEKAREVHKTLAFSTPETSTNTEGATVWKRTTQELKTAFKAYCNPRKNLTFERHKLNTRNQDENETIDQYVTALRTLAATCEFESLHDGLIRDRIVCGIKAQTLKERMLRENDLTLQKAIDICRAAETSRDQLKSLCGGEKKNNIDTLGRDRRNRYTHEASHQKSNNQQQRGKACGNCGRSHAPKTCPAYGKPCNHCHKL
ncbi:Hypothetical predicted protein [Paramuricea clavata]|uniref:Uncharacterized protein n=1 Tax=Paramuricea clavata TaxID=317549 RepID=A0A7D9LPF6_PARCT|nr:Hypothetical predicted protein [Paramuricea clavata]